MSTSYITLSTSDSSISKKFYAIMANSNSYVESYSRNQSVDINVEGDLLITNGGNHAAFSYVLSVMADPDEVGFGSKEDLLNLWLLNNPNATPTDVITLTDHYGNTHTVKFDKTLDLAPLTVALEDENAIFYIPIKLFEVVDTDE